GVVGAVAGHVNYAPGCRQRQAGEAFHGKIDSATDGGDSAERSRRRSNSIGECCRGGLVANNGPPDNTTNLIVATELDIPHINGTRGPSLDSRKHALVQKSRGIASLLKCEFGFVDAGRYISDQREGHVSRGGR